MRKFVLSMIFLGMTTYAAASPFIAEADRLFSERTPASGALEARKLYEMEISSNSTSSEPLWKAARACYWLAEHETEKKEKIKNFEDGIALAQRAVALDPKSVDAHFWLAGLYGSYGESKGVLKSLALVNPIRKELNTINRLNDQYQGGAGYRVLGIVDYKVPGFAGGSKKRALEQLNKALAIDPKNAFNQYYMAEYLATAGGNKSKAREHLAVLNELEVTEDVDQPDLEMMKAKGKKLSDQIGM